VQPRTERRFEDRDSQRACARLDGAIREADPPLPMPRAQVTRQCFNPFKAMLLGPKLEERQRLFIWGVQVVAPAVLPLLWPISEAQRTLLRRKPCEVSVRVLRGPPILFPEQPRE
jgi:hypothetical protein